jgi:hypothetical protein
MSKLLAFTIIAVLCLVSVGSPAMGNESSEKIN